MMDVYTNINGVFVKKIVRAPYICTVPCGGPEAIKCYPDAKTFIINGEKMGWSEKEKIIIAPLGIGADHLDKLINILTSICNLQNNNGR